MEMLIAKRFEYQPDRADDGGSYFSLKIDITTRKLGYLAAI
jgi:hypothetical protein